MKTYHDMIALAETGSVPPTETGAHFAPATYPEIVSECMERFNREVLGVPAPAVDEEAEQRLLDDAAWQSEESEF